MLDSFETLKIKNAYPPVATLKDQAKLLIETPINPYCLATIVIPVRNEAEHLSKTLASVVRQVNVKNKPLDPDSYEIIVLANNCRDESARIAGQWQKKPSLPKIHVAEVTLSQENSNVGYVRRWLMNEAYRRLTKNRFGGGIIATTDGDTQVSPNWLAATTQEIQRGADAVGGRIIIDRDEQKKMDKKARRFHLRDACYRLLATEFAALLDFLPHDPFPRHHQHFNGSFAVTTAAFRRAGGVPKVKFLEDVAFYQALLRIDAKFRHSPNVRVFTSARRIGRTEAGLSTQLEEWVIMGQNGDSYLVESVESIEKRLIIQGNLRRLWKSANAGNYFNHNKLAKIATDFHISGEQLSAELHRNQTFGSFIEKLEKLQQLNGEWRTQYPLVAVEQAIFDLRQKLEKLRRN